MAKSSTTAHETSEDYETRCFLNIYKDLKAGLRLADYNVKISAIFYCEKGQTVVSKIKEKVHSKILHKDR